MNFCKGLVKLLPFHLDNEDCFSPTTESVRAAVTWTQGHEKCHCLISALEHFMVDGFWQDEKIPQWEYGLFVGCWLHILYWLYPIGCRDCMILYIGVVSIEAILLKQILRKKKKMKEHAIQFTSQNKHQQLLNSCIILYLYKKQYLCCKLNL